MRTTQKQNLGSSLYFMLYDSVKIHEISQATSDSHTSGIELYQDSSLSSTTFDSMIHCESINL